ncbi:fimbrial protein [Klebsiella michiganensis]|uniref:fimbrial protein n=1 Tax=Klebsiella michiganensis TaxID=1134687 RepID=UPI0031E26DFC
MMKPILAILGLIVTAVITPAQAENSQINISGTVIDNTCVVDTASQNMTVDLLTHATKQFFKLGSTSEMVPFSLVLVDCGSAATGVKVGFNGTTVATDPTLLINESASNAATGLGVQILNADREIITVNQDLDSTDWTTIQGGTTNTLNFYARMVANVYPVTAGLIRASATMILEFE